MLERRKHVYKIITIITVYTRYDKSTFSSLLRHVSETKRTYENVVPLYNRSKF
ncbi:hypothetical protein C0J52_27572 [Blattella germanica]|nr:hypothetical protein C0J52_27572 [Blattella germanica]